MPTLPDDAATCLTTGFLFVAGVFFGIMAVTPTVFRHRRESSQHKNTIQALQSAAGTASVTQPDGVPPRA